MALTIKELALRLNVPYATARNYILRGNIQGLRKGGKWEVDEVEVERFEKSGNQEVYPLDLTYLVEED